MAGAAPEKGAPEQSPCPFLLSASATWTYPVEGLCQGLPKGLVMIPSVEEYRTRCSRLGHMACPIYRARMGEDGLSGWLQSEYQTWALQPLGG